MSDVENLVSQSIIKCLEFLLQELKAILAVS